MGRDFHDWRECYNRARQAESERALRENDAARRARNERLGIAPPGAYETAKLERAYQQELVMNPHASQYNALYAIGEIEA